MSHRLPVPALARALRTAACAVGAAFAAGVATPALAGPVTIDFEGVTSYASIADYYAGGSDGAGVAGRTDLGVSFSGAALALANDALGTYFANAPSGATVMFATDGSALLNVAAGFTGTVAFWYSSASATTAAVQLWSGLGGTGSLLGSFDLAANAQSDGCDSAAFCHWTRLAASFAGTARSIGFGGNAGNVAFDNVTVTPVPEPSTSALLALGIAGLVFGVRRREFLNDR